MILSILDGWMKIFQKYNLVSDKEIGDNEESDCKSGTSDSEQSDRQAAPAVSGWHDVHNKYNFNTSCMCTRAKNT